MVGCGMLRQALGAVKDHTSIRLARVGNPSSLSDLEVAILKSTLHDETPLSDKHLRDILALSRSSRAHASSCVATLSRRLSRTHSWAVALKSLSLAHRLLSADPAAFEHHLSSSPFFDLSAFRDTSSPLPDAAAAWDFSAFVRTYSLYLHQRLDFRIHSSRRRRRRSSHAPTTPVRDMRTDRLFRRAEQLQALLDRFLACRPTGRARCNRLVAVALYPPLRESYEIYYGLHEIVSVFVDRFMEMEVKECIKVHGVFCRLSKQLEELRRFYGWCKAAGISRPVEFPNVEEITAKKLEVMEDFIKEKVALGCRVSKPVAAGEMGGRVRALPSPDEEEVAILKVAEGVDLLDMGEDDGGPSPPVAAPTWEDADDWEVALVNSARQLSEKEAEMGGFDMALLNGMCNQPRVAGSTGIMALPAPSWWCGGEGEAEEPFTAVAAPPSACVPLTETERKQVMWQQYVHNGYHLMEG